MLLAIDVGNTNIKFALFNGDNLDVTFRITTDSTRTSDELGLAVVNLINSRGIKNSEITDIIVSSVVPDVMHSLNNAMNKFFNARILVVKPGIKTGIKLIKTNPAEAGSDRIVNGVAAMNMYGGPVIVVDYGTATKFDLFGEDGSFESAVTCPGVMLSARALWEGTAKLPEVEIVNPGTILAKNTTVSLQAGILYGRIGEAEYIIDKMIEEYGHGPIKVVATGGLARIIFNETDKIQYLEPNLTMYGLKFIYDKNK